MRMSVTFAEMKQVCVTTFEEKQQVIATDFGTVNNVSDDSYKRGYAEGLASRTYETWTLTLADGSVIEKEVAML